MATAGQAEHATERALDAARRAERAADQTDARARDVDRWIRWGIALVLGAILGLALLMLGLFGDLRGEIAAGQVEIEAEISNVRDEITNLRDEIRQAVEEPTDETTVPDGN